MYTQVDATRARQQDCSCALRPSCTPNTPARKIVRSIHEGARDTATADAYATSRRQGKKVQMLFTHLKRILKLDRLRLRGPNGVKDEFLLAATALTGARGVISRQAISKARPLHKRS